MKKWKGEKLRLSWTRETLYNTGKVDREGDEQVVYSTKKKGRKTGNRKNRREESDWVSC